MKDKINSLAIVWNKQINITYIYVCVINIIKMNFRLWEIQFKVIRVSFEYKTTRVVRQIQTIFALPFTILIIRN